MTQYFETPMDLIDEFGYSYESHGIKRVLITRPDDSVTRIIQQTFTEGISSSFRETNEMLTCANIQLHYSLPFLFEESYATFLHQGPHLQERARRVHFTNSRRIRSLTDLTRNNEMECSEQALAIKIVQFPDWNLYGMKRKNGTLSRHVVLAHQFGDSKYMMIMDPSSRARKAVEDGRGFMMNQETFDTRYVRLPIKKNK